jgi:hypothetical protein
MKQPVAHAAASRITSTKNAEPLAFRRSRQRCNRGFAGIPPAVLSTCDGPSNDEGSRAASAGRAAPGVLVVTLRFTERSEALSFASLTASLAARIGYYFTTF